MTEVRQGDLDAMAPLFERYHRPILNFFYRLTGDRDSSQDLTQSVFERLIRYRHTYRDEAAFRPWLYRTARNVASDHWRRASRLAPAAARADGEDPAGDPVENAPDPSWRSQRDARDLQEALNRLPAADRELLVLSRFHGLRYDEIGAIMEKSATAVKVQAHRAIHALRQIYFERESAHEA